MNYQLGPYDPCPCGSGAKYKFCCAAKAKENRHGKFPIGTVAWYGPDDKITTKVVASVLLSDFAEPIQEKFSGENVSTDPAIADQIRRFFAQHGVKNVVATNANLRCPHEEGIDYPYGEDCPLCPFWARKQTTLQLMGDKTVDVAVEEQESDFEDDDEPKTDFDASFARAEAIVGNAEGTHEQ